MRRWLLLLMVALLPLRAWAGDAMAVSMWTPLATAELVAAPCHGGDMGRDSNEPAAMSHQGAQAQAMADIGAQTDEQSGNACAACDVCHGAAMMFAPLPDAQAPMGLQRQAGLLFERFASADAQRSHKPPIA